MATKTTQKKHGFNLDEEKDIFLAFVNKKIRNARKKIEAIEELAKRDKATLKAEQLEKINSRSEVNESIKTQEGLRDLYYSAFKIAKEEGRWQPGAEAASAGKKADEEGKVSEQPVAAAPAESQTQTPAQPQVQGQSEEERRAEHAQVSRDSLSKVLNLVHLAHFFHDQSRVQQWNQSQGGQNAADLEALTEFYTKVLTFSDADKLGKIGDKLNSSLDELVAYVEGADEPAVRNRTYRALQEAAENVVRSSAFQSQSADVRPPQRTVAAPEHSAIGSELKRGQEPQQEAPAAQQPVTRSPEKSAQAEAPKTETQGQKQDWTAIQDDEEDEETAENLREEHLQERNYEGEGGRPVEDHERPYTTLRDRQDEEEQKQAANPDDEWSTVKVKTKPKKEETYGGYRGGRGGRGGYRGGEGRGGRGGYRGGEGRDGERGGYRGNRPNRDQQEGQEGQEGTAGGEQQEGQGTNEGGRGGYRGGYRGGRGGYRGGDGEGGEGRGGYRGGRGGYRGGDGEGGEGRGGYRGGRGGYRGGEGGYRGGEGRGGYRGGQGRGGQGFERRQDNEGARPATTTEGQTATQ